MWPAGAVWLCGEPHGAWGGGARFFVRLLAVNVIATAMNVGWLRIHTETVVISRFMNSTRQVRNHIDHIDRDFIPVYDISTCMISL